MWQVFGARHPRGNSSYCIWIGWTLIGSPVPSMLCVSSGPAGVATCAGQSSTTSLFGRTSCADSKLRRSPCPRQFDNLIRSSMLSSQGQVDIHYRLMLGHIREEGQAFEEERKVTQLFTALR
jgi:hypothetical protein